MRVVAYLALDVAQWAEENFGDCDLNDSRRTRRAVKVAQQMAAIASATSQAAMESALAASMARWAANQTDPYAAYQAALESASATRDNSLISAYGTSMGATTAAHVAWVTSVSEAAVTKVNTLADDTVVKHHHRRHTNLFRCSAFVRTKCIIQGEQRNECNEGDN